MQQKKRWFNPAPVALALRVALGSNLDEIVTRGTMQSGIAYAMRDGRSQR